MEADEKFEAISYKSYEEYGYFLMGVRKKNGQATSHQLNLILKDTGRKDAWLERTKEQG